MENTKTFIESVGHLANYLSTQGASFEFLSGNSLLVDDGLVLVYDDKTRQVIPTGWDNNGWLFQFTNYITNLLITYIHYADLH